MTSWELSDDVGTTYHQTGAHRGGNETWEDFSIDFAPAVPADARHLTVNTAEGAYIHVALSEAI